MRALEEFVMKFPGFVFAIDALMWSAWGAAVFIFYTSPAASNLPLPANVDPSVYVIAMFVINVLLHFNLYRVVKLAGRGGEQ